MLDKMAQTAKTGAMTAKDRQEWQKMSKKVDQCSVGWTNAEQRDWRYILYNTKVNN